MSEETDPQCNQGKGKDGGKGIDGIIYRAKNNLIVNNGKRKAVKNIDEFPFPDWDLFDVETYLRIGGKKKVKAIKDGLLILVAMIILFFK